MDLEGNIEIFIGWNAYYRASRVPKRKIGSSDEDYENQLLQIMGQGCYVKPFLLSFMIITMSPY